LRTVLRRRFALFAVQCRGFGPEGANRCHYEPRPPAARLDIPPSGVLGIGLESKLQPAMVPRGAPLRADKFTVRGTVRAARVTAGSAVGALLVEEPHPARATTHASGRLAVTKFISAA
jgi:hypothetical protein